MGKKSKKKKKNKPQNSAKPETEPTSAETPETKPEAKKEANLETKKEAKIEAKPEPKTQEKASPSSVNNLSQATEIKALIGTPLYTRRQDERNMFENLEAIVVAIVLALIIRHYTMEAFVIPTGSMAPTLLGQHFNTECSNCKRVYPVNCSQGSTGRLEYLSYCQTCGAKTNVDNAASSEHVKQSLGIKGSFPFIGYSPVTGGDKILVDKIAYRFGSPKRFDIAVFKYPLGPERNFIKRIIGLPNERIRLSKGDIYANGKLIRKPESVQESYWLPIYDQNYPSSPPTPEQIEPDRPERWELRRTTEKTKYSNDGYLAKLYINGNAWIAKPGAGETKLEFKQSILNHREYNPDSSRGNSRIAHVTDKRVSLDFAVPEAGAPLKIGFKDSLTLLTLSIPTSPNQELTLSRPKSAHYSKPIKVSKSGIHCPPGKFHSVSFAWYDRQAIVKINGTTVLEWQDDTTKTDEFNCPFEIIAPPTGCVLQNIKAERDIYYDNENPPGELSLAEQNRVWDPNTNEIILDDKSYLGLGDNQTNSSDGRKWGPLREGHLVGRALIVFWGPGDIRVVK